MVHTTALPSTYHNTDGPLRSHSQRCLQTNGAGLSVELYYIRTSVILRKRARVYHLSKSTDFLGIRGSKAWRRSWARRILSGRCFC